MFVVLVSLSFKLPPMLFLAHFLSGSIVLRETAVAQLTAGQWKSLRDFRR